VRDIRAIPSKLRKATREGFDVLDFVWHHPANTGVRGRAVLRALRFQFRGRVLKRRTLTTIGNHSVLWAELHRPSSSRALYANPPDVPEMLVWQRAIRQGDLFVDVGANIGLYSLLAAECGASVVALEPDDSAADRLIENACLNGYAVELIRAAATESRGSVAFTTGLDAMNRVVTSGSSTRRVPATTVDEVLGHRRAAGLKIDVEGAERLVLAGASRALREHRIAIIQIEWNECSLKHLGETREPISRLLREYGYSVWRPDDAGNLCVPADSDFGSDVFARPDQSQSLHLDD
jgi:FkbM family methyltransferase